VWNCTSRLRAARALQSSQRRHALQVPNVASRALRQLTGPSPGDDDGFLGKTCAQARGGSLERFHRPAQVRYAAVAAKPLGKKCNCLLELLPLLAYLRPQGHDLRLKIDLAPSSFDSGFEECSFALKFRKIIADARDGFENLSALRDAGDCCSFLMFACDLNCSGFHEQKG
jgi:hypothetical protein